MPPPYPYAKGRRRPDEPNKDAVLEAGRELAERRTEAVRAAYRAFENTRPDDDPIERLGKLTDLSHALGELEQVAWVAALLSDNPARVLAERTGYSDQGARSAAWRAMAKLHRDGHFDAVPHAYQSMSQEIKPAAEPDLGQSL